MIREPLLADYARLLAASAIWGATFLCIEIALDDFSPIAIAAYRTILAAVLLIIICFWRGQSISLEKRSIILLLCIGTLNTVVPFTLIGWGQKSIDSATASILLATSPFATLLLSHFMTADDRFSWHKLLGLVLGFCGVLVLFAKGLLEGGGTFSGMMAVVIAAFCYALAGILIRRLPEMPSMVVAAGTLCCGGIIMLPMVLWFSPPWNQSVQLETLAAVIFLAIGPTAIGYVLRAQIIKFNGAIFMSTVGYLIPLFAVFWGWVFIDTRPTLPMLVALVLILSGIAMGQNRFRQLFYYK